MRNIEVSIIVPCYNQAQYLDECLQSVLDQTYQDWECIIVNDGSPDNTEEVAKKWLEKDTRFKYISKANGGLPSARNTGIDSADGFYILPLDSDDYISNNFLEKAVGKIKESKEIKVVNSIVKRFGHINDTWRVKFELKTLRFRNQISCTALYRKSDWALNGGYDINMKGGYEDWEFWLNMLKRGGRAELLEDIYLYYRIKEQSMYTDMMTNHTNEKMLRNYIFNKHFGLYDADALTLSEFYLEPEKKMTFRQTLRIIGKKIKNRLFS